MKEITVQYVQDWNNLAFSYSRWRWRICAGMDSSIQSQIIASEPIGISKTEFTELPQT